MFTFVLAECEVELMPRELARHPRVVARARKRRRDPAHLLLDQAQDHEAMRGLEGGDRRGRPDLAHAFLLLVQDSLLTARGLTRVLLHTRDDRLVRVRPDTRIMRNQAKFYQLFEDLLRQGEVPRGDPLLTVEAGWPLARVLDEACAGATKVLLDEGGALTRTAGFAALATGPAPVAVVFGGFPRGAFRQAPHALFDRALSVAPEPLPVWSALVPVLAGFEDAVLARGGEGNP